VRIAVLADIHGNAPALRAVQGELERGRLTVKLARHTVKLVTITERWATARGRRCVGVADKPDVDAGTGTEGSSLSFQVNGGPEVKLFDLDTSMLEQAALPNGTLDLSGLLATLSSEGASSLNRALGQNVFTTGQPVGGVTLIVPTPPGA
jgi:hypothetical protein